MDFTVESQKSSSTLVETIWSSQSTQAGSFTSLAVSLSELVFTCQKGTTGVMMRGPETKATAAHSPASAEFLGITF
jgi:hypothetical protein